MDEVDLVRSHYGRLEVRGEIAEYCRDRWVAVHCERLDDRGVRVMVRYRRCLLYTSPSPRDRQKSRMPSSA